MIGDETALEVMRKCASRGARRAQTGFAEVDALRRAGDAPDVVELVGASGSGKTELAMAAAVRWLLPGELGGGGGTVIWFDSDLKLDARRMVEVLLSRVERAVDAGKLTEERARDLATECLQRLLVFRCATSLQLLFTLNSFSEAWLREANVGMVVLDTVSSFYWEDLETEPISAGLHVSVPTAVRDLARRHPLLVLATTPLLHQPKPNNPAPEFMSQTWRSLVGVRLLLECSNGCGSATQLAAGQQRPLFRFAIGPAGLETLVNSVDV